VKRVLLSFLLFIAAGIGLFWAEEASAQTLGEAMADKALKLVGVPYRFGEESPQKGFDSSGLVYYLHHHVGITIPRTVKGQAQLGQTVSSGQLSPGDVLIFKNDQGEPSISALYVGQGKAAVSLPDSGVKVSSVETSWAKNHLLVAKRYWEQGSGSQTKAVQTQKSATRSGSTLGDAIIKTAEKYLGAPYRYGARAGSGYFDCSLFVQTVFAEHGIKLPRSSRQQAQVGSFVKWGEWKKGDLLFFWTRATGQGTVGHVAIYAGEGNIIHTYGSPGVTYSKITAKAWKETYMGARRVIP